MSSSQARYSFILSCASRSLRARASSFFLLFSSSFSALFNPADAPPERDDDLLPNDHERPILPLAAGGNMDGNDTIDRIVGNCVNVTFDAAAAAAAEERGKVEARLVTVRVR